MRRIGGVWGCLLALRSRAAQKFMEPARRAAPRPNARRPGGGFGRLRVLAQWGTWRSQAFGLKVRGLSLELGFKQGVYTPCVYDRTPIGSETSGGHGLLLKTVGR